MELDQTVSIQSLAARNLNVSVGSKTTQNTPQKQAFPLINLFAPFFHSVVNVFHSGGCRLVLGLMLFLQEKYDFFVN